MKCKVFHIQLTKEHLLEDENALNHFIETVNIKRIFASFTEKFLPCWSILIFYENKNDKTPETIFDPSQLDKNEIVLYEKLKNWRLNKSIEENIAPFMIAHNSWLVQMVKFPVKKMDDFLKIKGFGQKRTAKYGAEILGIINPDEKVYVLND